MRFREIASPIRITGFSVPGFGIQWDTPESEIKVARRVLAFLEDRRVLFNPYALEEAGQCVDSVLKIRETLTAEIGGLPTASVLAVHLRGIRAACRKFLDTQHISTSDLRHMRLYRSAPLESEFYIGLGDLRASVGLYVAALAARYGIDVEGELERVLPGPDEDIPEQGTASNRHSGYPRAERAKNAESPVPGYLLGSLCDLCARFVYSLAGAPCA